jgi:hypothetical protein
MDLTDVRVRHALATLEALKNIGEDLLGEGQRRAPLEEGTLRGSFELTYIVNGHRLEGPGAYALAVNAVRALARAGALESIDVEVSANTIYAAAQHEGIDFEHPLAGEAKFLEHPLAERQARYEAIIAAAQARSIR